MDKRPLRSSRRLSLSLKKTKKKEDGDKTKLDFNGKENTTKAILDGIGNETPTTGCNDVTSGAEKRFLSTSSSSRVALPSQDTVIVVSDDENDVQSPSKRSISEYFTPHKLQNGRSSTYATWTSREKQNANSTTGKKGALKTTSKRAIPKARRKICPTSNIKMLTKKYFDDSQKRITTFFNKEDENSQRIGYCSVMSNSVMPAIVSGDLNVEQLLHISIEENEDPLYFSQNETTSAIASPKQDEGKMCPVTIMDRIERAESLCYDPVREDWNMERVQVPVQMVDTSDGARIVCNDRSKSHNEENVRQTPASQTQVLPGQRARENKKKPRRPKVRTKVVCPSYKIIAGTNFAVDAFRYGNIEGVTHYFLTHFHADHYIGLKKTFCKPLIMSTITARLVQKFINVPEEYYVIIDLHQSSSIDGVEVIALDANHCPGGVMFLFRLPDGTTILHTGDFRASPEMEEYPEFWNTFIDCIYLDTTYLSSKYAFKSQWESVADARQLVEAYLKKHIGTNVMVVCGSYLIGKEKVWLELAVSLKMKVWTEPNRWKALKAIADPKQLSVLVANPTEADIHVLAMNKLTFDELNEHINKFPERYDSVIGIRPSGWEKNSKPQYRGRINIVGVEYSEHSSFDELKRFVKFLRPRDVISTVPYGNSNQNRTPTVPLSWYQGEVRPHRKELQLSITNFVAVSSRNKSSTLQMSAVCSDSLADADPKVKKYTERKAVTNVENVIDLVSDDDVKQNQCSENGEYSLDSDWLA